MVNFANAFPLPKIKKEMEEERGRNGGSKKKRKRSHMNFVPWERILDNR